ncbi:hypothetical protein WME73_10485 [Sorangium sp. So ce302]|uniref:hypothetical protein n=1 Tax=Sorangium sp. So ce302 TaxID=3133297 RepID=UPI003F60C8A0
MWPYQPHFRIALEVHARLTLEALIPAPDPRALLIGVRVPDSTDPNAVCVEPEAEDWDPAFFLDCMRLTEEIYETHPNQNLFFGDAPSMRDKPENLRRDSVRRAVEQLLSKYDAGNGTVSFVGNARRVGEFHVVPILQIAASVMAQLPRLPKQLRHDRWAGPQSLFEALVARILEEATEALTRPEPGRFEDFRNDQDALLRDAGRSFCSNLTLVTRDIMFQRVFDTLNVMSSLRYEGAANNGRIIFAPVGSPEVDLTLRLVAAVDMDDARLARKVLEISDDNLACVCHGRQGLVGFGSLKDLPAPEALVVRFSGHYRWELVFGKITLLTCQFGVPRLPREKLRKDQFESWISRVFRSIGPEQISHLWDITDQATRQAHGTMIVVSEDAAGEASRLATQAMPIEPRTVDAELVARISGIDGAVLIDPQGTCHAIGVILDGLATPEGDPARGARFNSAVRYLSSATAATACLVVSEDGYVDCLPRLRPRIRASLIRKYVDRLTASTVENYHKAINWLDNNRFYLNAEQCAKVNGELRRIRAAPQEVGEIRVLYRPFEVDANMTEECIFQD